MSPVRTSLSSRSVLCNCAAVNRIDIETKLHRGRIDAIEMITAMSPDELRAPRTRSEHDPSSWWSYADHFVHTTLIERDFNAMIRRHLRGDQAMAREMVDESGSALRPLDDIMGFVHRHTERWKVEQERKPLEELVRIGLAVRADTLGLLAELSDEELSSVVPNAPWADGTVGGILGVHTDHWSMHKRWASAGTGHVEQVVAGG